jgi:hypothetical protein
MTSSLAVILLNYKRPQNIGRIARSARDALPDAPILVYDQGGQADFRERGDVPWDESGSITPRQTAAPARGSCWRPASPSTSTLRSTTTLS